MADDKKTVVKANSNKYFKTQEEAREYAIKLLQAGLTYLEVTEEVDC